jgi:hypothetical protein
MTCLLHEKKNIQSKIKEKEALHCEDSEVSHSLTSPKTVLIP